MKRFIIKNPVVKIQNTVMNHESRPAKSNPEFRSDTIFGNWKLFKNDEKCFLFHLNSPFCSQDI